MSIWLFVAYGAVGLCGWFWWTRMRIEEENDSSSRQSPPPYRCVVIKPHPEACLGVRHLAGKRFLASAAPPLPLDNCGGSACQCRYAHFEDRRADERRRSNVLQRTQFPLPGQHDLRRGKDRRRSAGIASGANQAV